MKLALGKSGRVKGLKRVLSGLTAKHIHQAIKQYTDQNGEVDTYDESTKYDLVVDGVAYPPKAILGLAARSLLGQAFPSSYFVGGEGSTCFDILQSLGFVIATKSGAYDLELNQHNNPGSGNWGTSKTLHEGNATHQDQALGLTSAPTLKPKQPKGKAGTVNPDWARKEQAQQELGDAGEVAVIAFEKERLIAAGRADLADRIVHVALVDSSAGYDIKSFNEDGSTRLIEVKSTTGSIDTPFFISPNELAVSSTHIGSYWIYRLYEFDTSTGKGLFYLVTGDLKSSLLLEPSAYKAIPR